jgi:hypothetical protein
MALEGLRHACEQLGCALERYRRRLGIDQETLNIDLVSPA